MGFQEEWTEDCEKVSSPLCLPPDVELSLISTASSGEFFSSKQHSVSNDSLDIADFELSTEEVPEYSRVGSVIRMFEKLQQKSCNESSRGLQCKSIPEKKHTFSHPRVTVNVVATPPHAKAKVVATPPHDKAKVVATPPHDKAKVSATPPHAKAKLAATPPQEKAKVAATPPQEKVKVAATPPQRKANVTTAHLSKEANVVPISDNANSDHGQDDADSQSVSSSRSSPFLKARSLDRHARHSTLQRFRERKKPKSKRKQKTQQQSGQQSQSEDSPRASKSSCPQSSENRRATKPRAEEPISAIQKAPDTQLLAGELLYIDKENSSQNIGGMNTSLSSFGSETNKDSRKVGFQDMDQILYFQRSQQEVHFMFDEEDDNDFSMDSSGEASTEPSTESSHTTYSVESAQSFVCVVPEDITDITLFARGCVTSLCSNISQGRYGKPKEEWNSKRESEASDDTSSTYVTDNGKVNSKRPKDASSFERSKESIGFTGVHATNDCRHSKDALPRQRIAQENCKKHEEVEDSLEEIMANGYSSSTYVTDNGTANSKRPEDASSFERSQESIDFSGAYPRDNSKHSKDTLLRQQITQGNCKQDEEAEDSLDVLMASDDISSTHAIDKMAKSDFPEDFPSFMRSEESFEFSEVYPMDDSTSQNKDIVSPSNNDTENWSDNIRTQNVFDSFQMPSLSNTEELIGDAEWEKATSEATTQIATNVAGRRLTSSWHPKFDARETKLREKDTRDNEATVALLECATNIASDIALQDPSSAWPSEFGVWGVPVRPEADAATDDNIRPETFVTPPSKNHIHLLEESFLDYSSHEYSFYE